MASFLIFVKFDSRNYSLANSITTLNDNLALKADTSTAHTFKSTTATALKDIGLSGFYQISVPSSFSDYPTALASTPYGIVEVSVCNGYRAYCISATDGAVTVSKTIYGFSINSGVIVWGTAM